ncbi:GTPase ObgE [bacterium]|nr:GTPase ObgE [bacterium]
MIDIANIKINGGNGGDGIVHFLREKFMPKGGPDGGDGGGGGDVYFVATTDLATLADFRSKQNFKAESGEAGREKNQTGASGEDLYIKVPVGTLITELDGEDETLVADLCLPGQEHLAARGGLGGRGNTRFKSSTNRTPMQFTKGILGDEKDIKLEIKLVADVGLIGLPNAGKSTLINKLTNARAKVASYPFTTLSPNLGVCGLKGGQEIILADIPGLIEGASEGKGLGDEFLRHVERTRILVHLIDPLVEDAWESYELIQRELKEYGAGLSDKKEIVVINKLDITEIKEGFPEIKTEFEKNGIEILGISAVSGEGLEVLLERIQQVLAKVPEDYGFQVAEPVKIYTIENLPNRRIVFDEGRVQTKE